MSQISSCEKSSKVQSPNLHRSTSFSAQVSFLMVFWCLKQPKQLRISESKTTKINFNFNLLNQTINTKLPKQAKLQDNEMHDKNQENETPGRRGPSSGSFLGEDDTGYCESVWMITFCKFVPSGNDTQWRKVRQWLAVSGYNPSQSVTNIFEIWIFEYIGHEYIFGH